HHRGHPSSSATAQASSTTTPCGSKTASISRVARRASYAKAMAAPPKTYTYAVKPRRASRSPSRPTERPRNRLPVKKRIIRAHATSNSCGATYTPWRRNAAGACATASTRAARELNGNHSRRNDRDSAQVGPDRPSRAARCSASAARKTSQRSSPVPAGSSSSNASRVGASSQPYSSRNSATSRHRPDSSACCSKRPSLASVSGWYTLPRSFTLRRYYTPGPDPKNRHLSWTRHTASAYCPAVRIPGPSPAPSAQVSPGVGLTSHHANRPILIEGDPLPVRLTRSRVTKTTK